MTQADVGVVGLAVMGHNLVRNIASLGFRVAGYNRTFARTNIPIALKPCMVSGR